MSDEIKNTLLLTPTQEFLYPELKKGGYRVIDPYIGRNNVFFRIIRSLHFKSKLPLKKLWYRSFDKDDIKLVLVTRESFLTRDYIEWITDILPNARFAALFPNKIKEKNIDEINMLRSYNFELISSDPADCQKYGLNSRLGLLYLRHLKVEKKEPRFDVFYIGRAKKGREELIREYQKKLAAHGLSLDIELVSPYPYGIPLNGYKWPVKYCDILKKLSSVKAILHVAQGAGEGITIRVIEAAVNNIKLITDDVTIKQTPLYRKENVFILGQDDIETINDFVNSPFIPVKQEILDTLYMDHNLKEYYRENNL